MGPKPPAAGAATPCAEQVRTAVMLGQTSRWPLPPYSLGYAFTLVLNKAQKVKLIWEELVLQVLCDFSLLSLQPCVLTGAAPPFYHMHGCLFLH